MYELDYTMEKVTLTKKSVESLKVTNPRRIHRGQVHSIYMALIKGEHFDSNFVVNTNGGKTHIIDGQHRLLALKHFFKQRPDERIPVYFATYRALSPEQERQIYTKWNISITQSTDDFINSYKETIPMFERLTSEIPCSVYGCNSKMRLRDITNAYHASSENPYHGGENKTKMDVVRYLQELKEKDADLIIKYFNVIFSIFNDDRRDWVRLPAFKNVIFRALFFLVSNNVNRLSESYLCRRMKTVLKDRAIMEEFSRYYGRRASVDAYLAFKRLLNESQSDNDKRFV